MFCLEVLKMLDFLHKVLMNFVKVGREFFCSGARREMEATIKILQDRNGC